MPSPDQILRKDAINANIKSTIKERGIVVNIAATTTHNYIIVKPVSNTRMVKAASFITTGVDGRLQYLTIAGDLDEVGKYKLQADLVFPGGYDGPTDIGSFWVEDNL